MIHLARRVLASEYMKPLDIILKRVHFTVSAHDTGQAVRFATHALHSHLQQQVNCGVSKIMAADPPMTICLKDNSGVSQS